MHSKYIFKYKINSKSMIYEICAHIILYGSFACMLHATAIYNNNIII